MAGVNSSSEEEPVTWLRKTIEADLAEARHVIALCIGGCAQPCPFHPAAAAEWREMSSGVLNISEGLDRAGAWEGVWAMGDSRVTRFIAVNDPQSVIARCEAELAILDEHGGEHMCYENVRDGNTFDLYIGDCRVVRHLASAYKHRSGYQESDWKQP